MWYSGCVLLCNFIPEFTGLISNYHFITIHGFCGSGIQDVFVGHFLHVIAISQLMAGVGRADGWLEQLEMAGNLFLSLSGLFAWAFGFPHKRWPLSHWAANMAAEVYKRRWGNCIRFYDLAWKSLLLDSSQASPH